MLNCMALLKGHMMTPSDLHPLTCSPVFLSKNCLFIVKTEDSVPEIEVSHNQQYMLRTCWECQEFC